METYQQQYSSSAMGEISQAVDADPEDCESETAIIISPIRRWALLIIEHFMFENCIMMVIVANVFTLALHDPLLGDREGRNDPLYGLGRWCGGVQRSNSPSV